MRSNVKLLLMKSYKDTVPTMKRVSLQLNTGQVCHSNVGQDLQNRASLCYSTNFKKRTDALNAQRAGLDQCLQRPQINAGLKSNNRTFSSKPIKRKKQLGVYNVGQPLKNDLERIEVRARSLLMKHKKLELMNKEKPDEVLQNYDTIKTQPLFEDKIIQSMTDNQMLQTCPNFTEPSLKQIQLQSQCIPIHRISFTASSQNQSPKYKSQKIKRVSTTKTQVSSSHDDQNTKQKIIQSEQVSNRIFTAPAQSQSHIHQFPTKYNKQSLKTNNINFSQHFAIEDKSSVFPTCRKMTLSNINKYYQLCIEEIKTTELKKKHSKQQSKYKQTNSPNNKFFHDGFKKSTVDPIPTSNNNSKSNLTNNTFQYNFSQINTNSNKKQKQYPIPPQMARRIASAGPTRLLENTNYLIKSCNKPVTNSCLTTTKIVRPQIVQHNLWEEIRNTLEEGEEIGYEMCSKKQLIERETLLFNKKGSNNGYGKMDRIFSFDRRQTFYEGNNKKQAQFLKMARSKSTKNEPTQRKPEEQKLAAWQITPQACAGDHFGSNQLYNL